MKKTGLVTLAIILLSIVILGYFAVRANRNKNEVPTGPGQYDDIAKCLTEKGVIFYGAYWCPHCANQKKMFGPSVQYIKYVECDAGGKNAQPGLCQQVGIEGYPTWIIKGQKYSGEQDPQRLAALAGCAQ